MIKTEKETETYLYLNGIKPREAISLDKDIVFASSSCNPTPDEIIARSKSEVDIGVACIFLRSVSSYIHIKAETSRQLAIKAWNAQWDAVLLGALHNCEVGFNFQADVSPENFTLSKKFHVANYQLKGLNRDNIKNITVSEHKWLKNNYSKAKSLMDNEMYSNAVHSLSSYRWHSMPRAQLALLWSAIEGIFGVDYELSFRLSLYISKYLSPNRKDSQKKIFSDIKKLYTIRSKAVHGGKLKNSTDAINSTVTILRKLVMKCAENGKLPETNNLVP